MKGTVVYKVKLQVLVPPVCWIFLSFSCHPSAELYRKRMFELLLSAYSTISTQDTAQFLGMNENDATNCKILSYSVLAVSKSLFLVHNKALNELKFIKLLNR